MECAEARNLIDRGAIPGSQTALSARLGFHLASCAACRSYRTHYDAFLQSLFDQPVPAPAFPRRAYPLQQLSRGLLLGFVLVALTILFGIAGIAWRTNQNLEAISSVARGVDPALIGSSPAPIATQYLPTSAPLLLAEPGTQPTPTHWPTLVPALPTSTLLAAEVSMPTPAPPQSLTVLLLGSDARPGETSIPRTDTLILVRVEPAQGRIALLSLPRDLWVEIPGYGQNRLNTAYVWGEYYDGFGGGIELARRTASELLGLPIDYVALINFEGFSGLIDSIGGITVEVERELYDPQFPTMDNRTREAYFAPGYQHMDGATALVYSRIRHPDNDFMRIQRQQQVLIAIAMQLRLRGDRVNLLSADQLSGALVGYVQTTMPKEQLLSLIWAMRNLDPAKVERYALSEQAVHLGVGADRYALQADPQQLSALATRFRQP